MATLSLVKCLTYPSSKKRQRLRDFGIRLGDLETGPHNAITDVPDVRVGHTTVSFGDGAFEPGVGPARTGVTVVVPHGGDLFDERVSASVYAWNGCGVVTGLDWVKESGMLEGPIFLTNTYSVGTVYDAALTWMISNHPNSGISEESYLPVVGECYDGTLNDVQGRHVKPEHVLSALSSAHVGRVTEGAVGGGTGMICYQFKGGIGTSSRLLSGKLEGYTLGVLVNSNHGLRGQLRIAGIPVGKLIADNLVEKKVDGSICIVVATDAPLNPLQLERVAKRAIMGLARTGATANNGSGDFVIAFSTTRKTYRQDNHAQVNLAEIQGDQINQVFQASVDATEEAVLNSILMAETTVGRNGNTAYALPLGRLKTIIDRYKELLDDP